MKRKIFRSCLLCIAVFICLAGCGKKKQADKAGNDGTTEKGGPILNSPEDIQLKAVDDQGNYCFKYGDAEFSAIATEDNWKILDSYRITDHDDMVIICKALISIRPVHGRDLVSYRTAEDMAYEWEQHNTAFVLLPSDNPWKEHARDVDLDPADQGKSLEEIYEDRTGETFGFKVPSED